ncbi:MAG: YceI family protein [Acidimicrobiia bacterium]|nr:YceI family protein [Acidimicrobiia bacterium]
MNRRNLLIGAVGVVVVLAGAVWFFFLRSDAPPPATLEDAVAAVTSTTEAPAADPEDTPTETTSPPVTTTEAARDGLDGAWTVDQNVSFVGYRIDEELANLGSITAVGRTSEIQAALDYAGTAISSLSVTVDMTTLESDRSPRDSAMRTRGLETNTFPEATFVLTGPLDLGAVPTEGEAFTASATGDLNLHGVTQTITLDMEGTLVDGTMVVVGSVEIALADYGIEKPTGFSVLDIADVGILELQLAFIPA